MKSLGRLAAAFLCGSLLVAVGATTASAQTENCTEIDFLPVTITIPGAYCLQRDLSTPITTVNAINIAADNVVIDLNGFTLGGLTELTSENIGTQAQGIFAFLRNNITVKNGTVRGFFTGIHIASGSVCVIENVRVDLNTSVGIRVSNRHSIIRNNMIVNTGPGPVSRPDSESTGIFLAGSGVRALNNDVTDTNAQGTGGAFAIAVNADNAVVENNRLSNTPSPPNPRTGGIIVAGPDVLVVNNRIINMASGIEFTVPSGKFRDNLTSGVAVPYKGGTDAGNNN